MTTDIKFTDDTMNLEGNVSITGKLKVPDIGETKVFALKGTPWLGSPVNIFLKTEDVSIVNPADPSGPDQKRGIALSHISEGDILKINRDSGYKGGVSIDGVVTTNTLNSKSMTVENSISLSNPKYIPATEVGPLKGLRMALAHSEGDVLHINAGKLYKGGVSIDGTVKVESDGEINIGAVKIKPCPLNYEQFTTHLHSLTIGSDSIVFETKPLIPPTAPSTKIDLLAVITQLQKDVVDLKKQIEILKSGGH